MDELRIAVANWEFGGIDKATLNRDRWTKTVAALRDWDPHVLLCQEMTALVPYGLSKHLHDTANALGMAQAFVGPPGAQSATGNRPGILTAPGLTVIDNGPPPLLGPGLEPCWCHVIVDIPELGTPLNLYSIHMPAFSATLQRVYAEWLTARITQNRQRALIGGDFNGYSGQGLGPQPDLTGLPVHLIPTRMHVAPDGTRTLNTAVHDLLTDMGLIDVAVLLPPEQRDPAPLTPTGITGVDRVDRGYVTPDLAPLVTSYRQARTGGSDHDAFMWTMRLSPASAR